MPAGKPIRRDSGRRPRGRSIGSSPPTRCSISQAGVYGRWFVGAECNTCYNAVDRHVATRGDQAAIIYDSPVTDTKRSITYAELQDEVATLAAVLQDMGVDKGDRVVIYMPMIPEAGFAMLACARIGAIHSVVFGGFAAKELATRIDDAKPKVILSASCGIEGARVVPYKPLLDEAIALSATSRKPASSSSGRSSHARSSRAATGIGRAPSTPRGPKGARPNACRSRPPIRSTCSTPRARPACRRASCATTAAIWSRSNGPWAISSA